MVSTKKRAASWLLSLTLLILAVPAQATIQCYECHGTKDPIDYRPVDTPNRDETTGGFPGSHRSHISGPAEPVTCVKCHPGSDAYTSSHRDGTIELSSNMNSSPLNGTYSKGVFFNQTTTPAFGTCSNVNCHFETDTPPWGSGSFNYTDSTVNDCNRCHGAPPVDGTHAAHHNYYGPGSTSCARCHFDHTKEVAKFAHATSAGKRNLQLYGFSYSKSANTEYPNYLPSQTQPASRNGTCSNISCHGNSSATWGEGSACLGCHSVVQGNRAAIAPQFSANSHHIQGTITNAHCYQCHWEANSDGSINNAYHHSESPGAPVELVVYGAGLRPTEYSAGTTAVQYTANGTRSEIQKINSHCLGCHNDQNSASQPFGDGKTPKQYAWDGTSVAARYNQSGMTTWGKFSTANGSNKRADKAYSAHGNAAANQRGWNTTNGVDGAIANTSGSTSVQCYDCHNSHGSTVAGITSRYSSATGKYRGGILKETVNGLGGYATSYRPMAGGSAADKNVRNAGASICLDCHLNQSAATTPWGYGSTYGATQAILGYWDAPMYKDYSTSGAEQRYSYKKANPVKGGHFGASSPLSRSPMSTIDGLCTPCHDPHGVSPTLGANQQYAVPLLKGTWVTSPYKEDTAPADNTHFTNRPDIGYEGVPYHIDQNTFGSSIKDAVAGIGETESQTEGLCLGCHPKESLTDGTTHTWKGKNRIHESVKGWKTANGTVQHNYSCSKCHSPHNNSSLPRLMVTNCLDSRHKGRSINNPSPVTSDHGWRYYGGECSGAAAEFGDWVWCLSLAGSGAFSGSGAGQMPGSWSGSKPGFQGYDVGCHESNSGDQQWNEVTPWVVNPTVLPAPPAIGQPVALSTSSIRWTYTDTTNDQDGFRVHDSGNAVKASTANAKRTYVDETGLTANTRYTRHIHAYNALGDSLPSGDASVYTWPKAPDVTADKPNLTWYATPDVVFTNAAGFGLGGVDHYRYVWTQSWPYSITGNETIWNGGTLTKTATADGKWYLYVKSYNGDDVGDDSYVGSGQYGPYYFDGSAPTASAPNPENGGTGAITNPLVFTISDANSGIDWASFSIQINGNMGYAKSYTAADTAIVTKTGSTASYAVTVKPDAAYGNGEVITWSFRVKDMVGHELVSPTWSFTALNTAVAAPTIGAASSYAPDWIRWTFIDNSDNETGFRLHDPNHVVKATTSSSSFVDEYGLAPNTQYTRHVHAYNANGESAPSQSASRYTLAPSPNVTSDKAVSTWSNAPVTFTNAAGFGPGAVQYYRYTWDQTAVNYISSGTEPLWESGSLVMTPASDGNWYLHVASYNNENAKGPTTNYGPYFFDGTAPTGLAGASPANGATGLPVNTVLSSTVATDSGSGSVQYLFQIAKDNGFTQEVQSSGWQTTTSYAPLLDGGTAYYWRVKARDKVLNETPYTAPARSFTTVNVQVSRVTWTTKGDFENNASTTGSPTIRNQVVISGTNQTDDADVTLPGKKWKSPTVAGGGGHVLAVKSDGSVWSWGNNYNGQLGDGTSGNGANKLIPVQVSGLGAGSGVIAVSATNNSSLALKSDGSVVAWGRNEYGQLGDGTTVDKPVPILVTGLGAGSGVIAIVAGEQHFMALKSDGTVWGWGDNSYYQLGDGTWTPRSTPVKVPGLTGVVGIVAGKLNSFAVKADGSVWAWGCNSHGQLGDGSTTYRSSPVQVSGMGPGSGVFALAGGYTHTVALKSDGSVHTWGNNYFGQLGIGSTGGYRTTPTQILPPGSGANAVAAERQSSLLLKDDGSVWAWGQNGSGQVGDGTTTQRTTPVPVSGFGANSGVVALSAGQYFYQALKGDGSISAWGANQYGEIIGGSMGTNSAPVPNTLISGVLMPFTYNSLYTSPGTVTRLKLNAGFSATWSGIYWNGSVSSPNASIKCRTRGAGTEGGLDSALWSDYYLSSGAGITTPSSQWLEVELTLLSSDNSAAPTVNDLTVTYFP